MANVVPLGSLTLMIVPFRSFSTVMQLPVKAKKSRLSDRNKKSPPKRAFKGLMKLLNRVAAVWNRHLDHISSGFVFTDFRRGMAD